MRRWEQLQIKLSHFILEEIIERRRTVITIEDKRNPSNIRYYTCDDKGHYSRYCPRNSVSFYKKSNKEIHHAHIVEDDEPTNSKKKKKIPQVMRNMNSTSKEKYHTLIHISIWIRRNVVSDTQNQYAGSHNQMRKQKDPIILART